MPLASNEFGHLGSFYGILTLFVLILQKATLKAQRSMNYYKTEMEKKEAMHYTQYFETNISIVSFHKWETLITILPNF